MHASNIWIDPLMLKTKLILCKKAVTISEYNKKFLLNKYGEQFANKIDVIHCGIDLEKVKPRSKKRGILPIILSVGQLVERKGFRYLLDACHILKDKGFDFQCCIAGDGEEMDLLTRMSVSLGINDVVTFLGAQPQEQIVKLMEDASIFVLASIITDWGGREGIPVVLMEAMAMELPVVSTKTVGIPELIENKREGLLVEQKNAVELASAIEHLLKNAELREEMGRQGRTKVMREFNIAHFPNQIYNIFN
jgi:glycosyltransferase involved in cell wall biosynthesis